MSENGEVMDRALAAKTVRDYVCSACWGHLLEFYEPCDQSRVRCGKYPEHRGFVTKYYVEHRRSDSVGEMLDVNYTFRKIIPGLSSGKSPEEILEEIGG
jgi:hypothetical protein